MLFNSLHFFIFFPLVVGGYFWLPHKLRWAFLLMASCYFYMAFIPAYILILGATIVVDYIAGIYIERSAGRKRKVYLILSLLTNVGFLAFFKYWDFAAANVNQLAELLHWNYSISFLNIILPIGLSFHTFQAMSYTIEVYRGHQKAERHFGIYALYVMFFPQLVAGPIERPQNLLHQFYEKHEFDYRNAVDGLLQIGWGLFKKVVIADRLAVYVNQVYRQPHEYDSFSLILATLLFSYQLYCDFSGYSDIALGSARVLGFRLMKNFDRPYYSKSISEFWRRWHISLFSWFRDYVYYPIAYSSRSHVQMRIYGGLMLTFLLSGLWHGADWKYIVFGGLNGVYIVVSLLTKKIRAGFVRLLYLDRAPRLHKFLQIGTTYSLFCISLIFFRANSAQEGWYALTKIFTDFIPSLQHASVQSLWQLFSFENGLSKVDLLIGLIAVGILESIQLAGSVRDLKIWLREQPVWLRWSVYYILILSIVGFGKFGAQQFIYFQF
jgi:alginate O-acetyltransferase complex protein AlgI